PESRVRPWSLRSTLWRRTSAGWHTRWRLRADGRCLCSGRSPTTCCRGPRRSSAPRCCWTLPTLMLFTSSTVCVCVCVCGVCCGVLHVLACWLCVCVCVCGVCVCVCVCVCLCVVVCMCVCV